MLDLVNKKVFYMLGWGEGGLHFLRQNSFQSSQCQHGGERGLHSLLHAEWLDGGLECASGCGYLCVTWCGG